MNIKLSFLLCSRFFPCFLEIFLLSGRISIFFILFFNMVGVSKFQSEIMSFFFFLLILFREGNFIL